MSTKSKQLYGRIFAIAAVLIFVFCAAPTVGDATAAAPKEEKKEKRIKMEFKDAKWAAVIEWLSDQTHLTYVSNHAPPLGTFTFSTPGKTYTIEEVTIILNDHLLKQDYVLLKRRSHITLLKVAR